MRKRTNLVVETTRMGSRDPDRLDITRKNADRITTAFAPPDILLAPFIARRRKRNERLRGRPDLAAELEAEEQLDFERYAEAYRDYLRKSWRHHPASWRWILDQDRVVLMCFCTDAHRCHRTVLAEVLGKLGADVRGEIESHQRELFG